MDQARPNGAPPTIEVAPRPVIISLHGIRTAGAWQKALATPIAAAGGIPVALDFGYFGAMKLLSSSARDDRVKWLRDEVGRIRSRFPDAPMSIVAHSFGSYITAALLESHPSVCFDTVIFSGSIVRNDFPWTHMLDSYRVGFMANYIGRNDPWPRVAKWFVGGAGDSGRVGFSAQHPALYQHASDLYEHSDYFSEPTFTQYWLATLIFPQRLLLDELRSLTEKVHRLLEISPGLYDTRSGRVCSSPTRAVRTTTGRCRASRWPMPGSSSRGRSWTSCCRATTHVHCRICCRPSLEAIGDGEPVKWFRNADPHRGHPDLVAAVGSPVLRPLTDGAPAGLVQLEILANGAENDRDALEAVVDEAEVLMREAAMTMAARIGGAFR